MIKIFDLLTFFIKKILPMILGIAVVGVAIYLAYIFIEKILQY
jgi:hypothetical protein